MTAGIVAFAKSIPITMLPSGITITWKAKAGKPGSGAMWWHNGFTRDLLQQMRETFPENAV